MTLEIVEISASLKAQVPEISPIGSIHLPVKGQPNLVARIIPQQVICLGKNYAEHAKELSSKTPEEPLLFAKVPSAIIGNGRAIIHPGRSVGRVDHEVELAVIIGKTARTVPAAEALNYVFGYTVVNDVTARDLQGILKSQGHPWFLSKSFATFCPLGPVVVPRKDLDASALALECLVNGAPRQQGNTRDMLHPVPALVEYITARFPLLPGDVIATGTPAGIGPLKPGDTVLCRVEGIGDLVNPVEGEMQKKKPSVLKSTPEFVED